MNENILPNGIATAQFIEDSNRLDNEELMNKYNVSARTIRRWRQFIRQADQEIISTFPESPSPLCTNYLKLNYENCCIIGDAEVPDHDPEIFEMAARLGEKLGLEHLIVSGDFMSMDAFSAWPADNPQSCSFERDLNIAMKSIKIFLGNFDTVDYITGNHERRLARQNKGQNNLGLYLKHIHGLQYSSYPYCELISGGKEILITHQEDYSRIPLSIPLKLAAIHHKNILCAHNHREAFGWDPSGKYWLAEHGCARDSSRTLYKSMKMTSHPTWQQGLAIIISGNLFLINKRNFAFWMSCVDLGRQQ
jgi:hypothetical protein